MHSGSERPQRRTSFPGLEDLATRRRELMEELVKVRRERGWSQTEIAARMGTSQSAVARLEGGALD
ncbi:MAG: Antitoxin HigA, partial [Pseudonocardia sp.]|nr:Antitoxin HigA [Pseudonocardia sp.]